MVKIIFGVISVGILYYVLTPLLGRKVSWVDPEDPDDERMRELELTKKINLKALKDIEFELASGKVNDEDYLDLKDHYSRKVSRIMSLIEDLAEEGTVEVHHGERGKKNPEGDEGSEENENELDGDEDELDEDEDELDEDEEWDEDEDDEDEEDGDDDEILQGRDSDDEDEEWDEDDEHEHRSIKGPTLAVLALVLTVGVGAALFQMGKQSAARVSVAQVPVAQARATPVPATPAPATPAASQPSPYSEQAGLEHLVKYVQENPWNVTSHIILGEYYLDAGNINVALAHFESAEGIKPGDGRVLSNLGKTYRKLGNPDQAIDKFKAAAEAEPESLEHLYQLGLVYGYDKGNLPQALALFEEVLSQQPSEELRATVDEELRKLGLSDG